MGSYDWIEDAKDFLHGDPDCAHMLIAAHFGGEDTHFSANVPTREQLEWFKHRFAELCAKLERQYEVQGDG